MTLLVVIELNILLTRSTSFWWDFGAPGAPPPSLALLAPVTLFLTAGTFIAVYWPEQVKPDGGRGAMRGAGECSCVHPSDIS